MLKLFSFLILINYLTNYKVSPERKSSDLVKPEIVSTVHMEQGDSEDMTLLNSIIRKSYTACSKVSVYALDIVAWFNSVLGIRSQQKNSPDKAFEESFIG